MPIPLAIPLILGGVSLATSIGSKIAHKQAKPERNTTVNLMSQYDMYNPGTSMIQKQEGLKMSEPNNNLSKGLGIASTVTGVASSVVAPFAGPAAATTKGISSASDISNSVQAAQTTQPIQIAGDVSKMSSVSNVNPGLLSTPPSVSNFAGSGNLINKVPSLQVNNDSSILPKGSQVTNTVNDGLQTTKQALMSLPGDTQSKSINEPVIEDDSQNPIKKKKNEDILSSDNTIDKTLKGGVGNDRTTNGNSLLMDMGIKQREMPSLMNNQFSGLNNNSMNQSSINWNNILDMISQKRNT